MLPRETRNAYTGAGLMVIMEPRGAILPGMAEPRDAEDAPDEGQTGSPLEKVAAWRIADELGDAAVEDADRVSGDAVLARMAPQLAEAAGSIGATIAEGYARRSARDRIRYYEYSLGSVEETGTWYRRVRRVLDKPTLADRFSRLTSIRRLLLAMIRNERNGGNWNSPKK